MWSLRCGVLLRSFCWIRLEPFCCIPKSWATKVVFFVLFYQNLNLGEFFILHSNVKNIIAIFFFLRCLSIPAFIIVSFQKFATGLLLVFFVFGSSLSKFHFKIWKTLISIDYSLLPTTKIFFPPPTSLERGAQHPCGRSCTQYFFLQSQKHNFFIFASDSTFFKCTNATFFFNQFLRSIPEFLKSLSLMCKGGRMMFFFDEWIKFENSEINPVFSIIIDLHVLRTVNRQKAAVICVGRCEFDSHFVTNRMLKSIRIINTRTSWIE